MATRSPGYGMVPRSLLSSLKNQDYSQWQRKNVAKKQSALPPLSLSQRKKAGKRRSPPRSKDRRSARGKSTKSMHSMREKSRLPKLTAKEIMMEKSMANIKVMQRISKSRRITLEELKHHSNVLLRKNQALMEKIKEMDADTAKQSRELLQQYEMFGAIITTLRDSNQNQVGIAKRELMEREKMVEKEMARLDLEMSRMNTKVQTFQDEVNVLRSYMDKEYPVKAVQISSLLRSIRKLSEEQQDELEDVEDLSRRFLETLSRKAFEEKEHFFQSIAEKTLSQYHDGLVQMNRNNLELKRQIEAQKEIIADLVEEVRQLHRSVIKLHHSTGDPRNVIFADILLRRPKCTPDMDVVLNIPTDEDFPL